MSLLKKLTLAKREKKKENYFDFYLNSQITNLKKHIKDLSTLRRRDQKTLREKKVYLIINELNQIAHLYESFIRDLKKFENMKNNGLNVNLIEIEERISLMIEKKKSLRKDFESIYVNFKRTAMGLEDVPMKSILKKMHTSFDFDGKIVSFYDDQNVANF